MGVRAALLVLLVLLADAPPSPGSSVRGSTVNNLKQITVAMSSYRESMGTLPTDVLDRQGRPLLSWRVQLLPFLEHSSLYARFRLDEPWDSPHNRQLIEEIPKVYLSQWVRKDGRTCFLQPRGEDAIFLRRPPWLAPGLREDLGAKMLVVEVDDDHGVMWTRPQDLDYDPTDPHAGLARRWGIRFWGDKGAMAAQANGQVRLVWRYTDPDFLRARFSAGAPDSPIRRPSLVEAVRQPPFNALAVPFLHIAVIAFAGSVPVALRLLLRRTTSPGEFLFLMVGTIYTTLVCFLPLCFHTESAPLAYGRSEAGPLGMWVAPRLAGLLAGILALVWCWSSVSWRIFFAGISGFLLLGVLGGLATAPEEVPEAALLLAPCPITLGLAAVVSVFLTLLGESRAEIHQRPLAHWLGIVLCFLPLVFCVVWCGHGSVDPLPHDPFTQVRD